MSAKPVITAVTLAEFAGRLEVVAVSVPEVGGQ
jgi:hypothetical protein